MTLETASDYRQSHTAAGYGLTYNRAYQKSYYAAQWRLIEEPLLRKILGPLAGAHKTCLDFACGTGRITQVAADTFGSVAAVDVSKEMLSHVAPRGNVDLVCRDLTHASLDRRFDVALSFRFFLNAEPTLRSGALEAVSRHLSPGGHLICNIHMTSTSPMGRVYDALRTLAPKQAHKTMSHREFTELLAARGFETATTHWYGFMPRPGPLLPRLCELCVAPVENICKRWQVPNSLAQSFVVVARKS